MSPTDNTSSLTISRNHLCNKNAWTVTLYLIILHYMVYLYYLNRKQNNRQLIRTFVLSDAIRCRLHAAAYIDNTYVQAGTLRFLFEEDRIVRAETYTT